MISGCLLLFIALIDLLRQECLKKVFMGPLRQRQSVQRPIWPKEKSFGRDGLGGPGNPEFFVNSWAPVAGLPTWPNCDQM